MINSLTEKDELYLERLIDEKADAFEDWIEDSLRFKAEGMIRN